MSMKSVVVSAIALVTTFAWYTRKQGRFQSRLARERAVRTPHDREALFVLLHGLHGSAADLYFVRDCILREFAGSCSSGPDSIFSILRALSR